MKKLKKRIWSFRHVCLFIIFLLFAGFGVFTFAKFVSLKFHNYFLDSKHFYFTSNRLTDNNALYRVNNWSGVGSFTISFDLLSEKNSYVYTDYDIPYSVRAVCRSADPAGRSAAGHPHRAGSGPCCRRYRRRCFRAGGCIQRLPQACRYPDRTGHGGHRSSLGTAVSLAFCLVHRRRDRRFDPRRHRAWPQMVL